MQKPSPLRACALIVCAVLAACGPKTRADASPVTDALAEPAAGSCAVSIAGPRLVLRTKVAGRTLSYRWALPQPGSTGWFGTLAADVDGALALAWNDDSAIVWTGSATLRAAGWARAGDGATMTLHYDTAGGAADVTAHVACTGPTLVIETKVAKPLVSELRFPTPGHGGGLAKLPVPYDPYDIFYFANARLFETQYFDWSQSNAASQFYPKLTYPARTDGSRLPVDERLVVALSPVLADMFPPQLNQPSRYIADLSGRTIYDIWDGKGFDDVAAGLSRVRDASSGPCAVIIHAWQHSGYDNGLPQVLPANPQYGGDSGLKRAAAAASALGCRLALHQIYTDYYPNYPGFRFDDTIQMSDGTPGKSYLNPHTHIQSLAARPDRFVPLAQTQAPAVHQRFGTSAGYIDQNSGLRPWWRVDLAAGREGAGTFTPFIRYSYELWDYQRKVNQGPVFGEGQWNFYWAGGIDGVEAQPGKTTSNFAGDNIDMPLLVDFDLTRIHGYSVDHGMGYYDRWTNAYLVNSGAAHQQMQDIYRMQEVAFGHAPFLSGIDWHDPVAVWSETNLIAPVAARYSPSRVASIRYLVDGTWQPVEQAVARQSLRTVKIDYQNRLEIIANGGDAPVTAGRFALLKGGWAASGPDIRAASGWIGAARVEFVDTPDRLFANDRALVGAPIDFGPLATDGNINLVHASGTWTLRVLQGSRTSVVALLSGRFQVPAIVRSACGGTLQPREIDRHWTIPTQNCGVFTWEG